MKCLILAAGYATRLYPLTENFPKPLLLVGEKTILDWLVDDLASSGKIDAFIVVSNHRYVGSFEEWSRTKTQNITVLDDGSTENDNRLGAVKDIQFAVERCQIDEDLLVIAGDNVLDFSLNRLLEYAEEKKTSCILRYYENDEKKLPRCGVVTVAEDDLVLEMTEKSPTPATHWCCPPFYYYIRKDVHRVREGIESGCGTDAPGSYLSWLCGQTRIHAMVMPGSRYDIGNMESYRHVQTVYKGITKAGQSSSEQ
ncbi:MAG: nucleotidyltransferase family protein [Clostridia bacterium]|nr:nucleotidyltransferase family protein [Clostridia bacterium]